MTRSSKWSSCLTFLYIGFLIIILYAFLISPILTKYQQECGSWDKFLEILTMLHVNNNNTQMQMGQLSYDPLGSYIFA
jgi:surface polysaccharide O-acyltransferase-like enzyme